MNRRVFAGQLLAGLGACVSNTVGIAESLASPLPGCLPLLPLSGPTKWVRAELLGDVQRLFLVHLYNAQVTPLATLLSLAHRDLVQAHQLLNQASISTDWQKRLGPPTNFGSYSLQVEHAGVLITWQGLADLKGTIHTPRASLRAHGSKGVLQSVNFGSAYQLISLEGRIIRHQHA